MKHPQNDESGNWCETWIHRVSSVFIAFCEKPVTHYSEAVFCENNWVLTRTRLGTHYSSLSTVFHKNKFRLFILLYCKKNLLCVRLKTGLSGETLHRARNEKLFCEMVQTSSTYYSCSHLFHCFVGVSWLFENSV